MHSPHLTPKLRSEDYCRAVAEIRRCTLRISSFLPGFRCSAPSTCVGAHVGNVGKGMSTKVSDLMVVCGCLHCHDLLDRRDSRWTYLEENYAAAVAWRVVSALAETQGAMLAAGKLIVPKGTIT
jgi:hypothetical protein